jgi:hypothetical protein
MPLRRWTGSVFDAQQTIIHMLTADAAEKVDRECEILHAANNMLPADTDVRVCTESVKYCIVARLFKAKSGFLIKVLQYQYNIHVH